MDIFGPHLKLIERGAIRPVAKIEVSGADAGPEMLTPHLGCGGPNDETIVAETGFGKAFFHAMLRTDAVRAKPDGGDQNKNDGDDGLKSKVSIEQKHREKREQAEA